MMRLRAILDRSIRIKLLMVMAAFMVTVLQIIDAPIARSQQPLDQATRIDDLLRTIEESNNVAVGDQWGRDLSGYPNLIGIYSIHGRLLVLVAHDTQKQLVMDLSSGKFLLLDEEHSDELISLIKSGRQEMGVFSLQTRGGIEVKTEQSPGQTWSCQSNFSNYLTALDTGTGSTRSFFVIVKFPVRRESVGRCTGAVPSYKSISTTLGEAAIMMLGLSDHTLLVFDLSHGYLVRLDQRFRQHTTLQKKLFIVDAIPIINEFTGDPAIRYEIMKRAVDQVGRQGEEIGDDNVH